MIGIAIVVALLITAVVNGHHRCWGESPSGTRCLRRGDHTGWCRDAKGDSFCDFCGSWQHDCRRKRDHSGIDSERAA